MQDDGSQQPFESANYGDGWDTLVNDTRADQGAQDALPTEQAQLGDDPVPDPASDVHGQHAADGPPDVRSFSAFMPQLCGMHRH